METPRSFQFLPKERKYSSRCITWICQFPAFRVLACEVTRRCSVLFCVKRMSLLPLLTRDWWNGWDYPARITDQHFGMGLLDTDLHSPSLYRGFLLRPRTQGNVDNSGLSEVRNERDKFQVMLNCTHFRPEEIEVKTVDNSIVIHGKHEEKSDEHGFVTREFTRRYVLPEGTEPETVRSSLTPTGVLVIEAPKKSVESPPRNERIVPISIQQAAVDEK